MIPRSWFNTGLVYSSDLLHFQSLEVVSRCRDPQLQVTENYLDLWNLRKKFLYVVDLRFLEFAD